ncbi:MAG: DUF3472 domain-containing protein [Mariniblastus sp.]|nr:DUF3472 domain-containing protein [Mariniblastus sp.]
MSIPVGLRCTALLLLCFLFPCELMAQNPRACRSVHLWHSTKQGRQPESNAFYNEATVTQSAAGTYFMACGFDKGYFGIQELAGGKKVVLFSVWEPGAGDDPNATPAERRVKLVRAGEGVRVKRFGGEGTGGQSFYDYDWQVGQAYRFAVFAKPDGERTQFAGYFYIPEENRWQPMATFSTLTGGHLLRGLYSFVEDFRRNGKSATESRRALFGNGWTRVDQQWLPLTRTRFTADQTPSLNIDSGVDDDRFFLATGGDVQNDHTGLNQFSQLKQHDRKPPLDLPGPFDKEVAGRSIRVLAYNIKHGRGNDGQVDLQRSAQVIRRLNPDIVALQEIDSGVTRSGKIDEPAKLARMTGLSHHAFGPFFDYQGGQYGMAVLSRRPIKAQTNHRLPDGAEPRTSLDVTVAGPQGQAWFRLANVHFYRTEAERLAQARHLLAQLADRDLPTLIAGDFNSRPGSAVLDLFAESWTVPDKGEDRFTFSSERPSREIDFILYRPEDAFQVLDIDVIDEPVVSDHRPVTLDLRFSNQDRSP